MPALLSSSQTPASVSNIPNKRKTITCSGRHKYVLALHLAGKKVQEIHEETGYSIPQIYHILSDPRVLRLRQEIMSILDKEFEAQYRKVVAAVDSGLDENQPATVKLAAAKLWGDYHKKFQKVEINQTLNVTAEDIVVQIMNGNYTPQEA